MENNQAIIISKNGIKVIEECMKHDWIYTYTDTSTGQCIICSFEKKQLTKKNKTIKQ